MKHGQNVGFKDSGVEDKVNGNRLVEKYNFCGEINDGVSVQSNKTQQDYSRPKNFTTKACVVDLCKFKAKQETYKIGCFLSIRPHQNTNRNAEEEFACFTRNEENTNEDRENVNPFLVKEELNYIQEAGDMHEPTLLVTGTSFQIKNELAPKMDPHILV